MRSRCAMRISLLVGLAFSWLSTGRVSAESVPPMPPMPKLNQVEPESGPAYEKISLTEAVRRSLVRNPTAVVAFQEIKRAEALLVEARAASMPSLMANGILTRLDADRIYKGSTISPKNQQAGNLLVNVPLVAPRSWTQWSEASANLDATAAGSEDTRRTLAVTTARAYLAIISLKRQVDINARVGCTGPGSGGG